MVPILSTKEVSALSDIDKAVYLSLREALQKAERATNDMLHKQALVHERALIELDNFAKYTKNHMMSAIMSLPGSVSPPQNTGEDIVTRLANERRIWELHVEGATDQECKLEAQIRAQIASWRSTLVFWLL